VYDDGARVGTKVIANKSAHNDGVRLAVLIVVDQLPSWSFELDVENLPEGVARLRKHGVYFPRAEYPYAATYTAPGHAALATGTPPAVSGILGNGWRTSDGRGWASATADAQSPVWVPRASMGKLADAEGASGRKLRVEGVADVLRRETNGAGKSVAIALKRRAAILVLGKKPDLAIWYEPSLLAMTTSRYYASSLPQWIEKLAALELPTKLISIPWTPLDAARIARVTQFPDDDPGEAKPLGLGNTFPHDLRKTTDPARALRATPGATSLLFSTARAAVRGESLGADEIPDVLAVSVSSHDYAGHYWGQRSHERIDLMMRLDHDLGEFFTFLDATVGEDRYAVVFTSDHGATPLVERSRLKHRNARRIDTRLVYVVAEQAARAVLGPGLWIQDVSPSAIFLTSQWPKNERADAAITATVEAVRGIPGIGYAVRTRDVVGHCDAREGFAALVCRSILPGLSGEIYIAPDRYSSLTRGETSGTGHGTPHEDDRIVPVIVSAPGTKARVVSEVVSMLRVAPTITRMLGIPAPSRARGSALPIR